MTYEVSYIAFGYYTQRPRGELTSILLLLTINVSLYKRDPVIIIYLLPTSYLDYILAVRQGRYGSSIIHSIYRAIRTLGNIPTPFFLPIQSLLRMASSISFALINQADIPLQETQRDYLITIISSDLGRSCVTIKGDKANIIVVQIFPIF